MAELKPCPFCGGEAQIIIHRFHGIANCYGVGCVECHAGTHQFFLTEEKAIEAWNRRADNG